VQAAGLDPTPPAALGRAKRHPHQIGNRYRALTQVEKPAANLNTSFRKMTRSWNVVIPIALATRPMIGRKPRRQVVDELRAPEIKFAVDRAIALTLSSNLPCDETVQTLQVLLVCMLGKFEQHTIHGKCQNELGPRAFPK